MDITNTEQHLKLRANYMRVKQELAVSQTKVIELEKERDAARGEIASTKTKYDESKLKSENADLKGQLRSLSHRRVFDRLAKERGAPEDSHDLLWQASGYKAEKDDVDEAAMGTMLDELKTKPGVARLFGEQTETQTQTQTRQTAPGGGQGGRDNGSGRLKVTQDMIAPGSDWMNNNRAEFTTAMKENRVDFLG